MSNLDAKLDAYKHMQKALDLLKEDILMDLSTWRSKADEGFKVEAIMQVKREWEEFGTSISITEAKKIVDSYLEMA
jgi:hypothetical protein